MDSLQTVDWPGPFNAEDLYDHYSEIRSAGPITRSSVTGSLVVTGFDIAAEILKSRDVGSAEMLFPSRLRGAAEEWQDPENRLRLLVGSQMAFKDDDDHKRIRDVVQKSFTPTVVRGMVESTRALALDFVGDAGQSFDLMSTLALPLPARVIFEMLGVPEQDREQFVSWSTTLADFVGTSTVDDEYLTETQDRLEEFADYCARLAESQPVGSTVLRNMYDAHQEERLSWVEMVGNAMFLLAAGHETTTNLIGNGTLALLRQPQQFALLRDRPDLGGAAVEELLRFDAPVQTTFRMTRSPMDIDGHDIPAATHVIIHLGAANRDPDAFAEPDIVDITRNSRRHLAFASGVHTCLGAQLARMEAREALSVLTTRFPNLELAEEPTPRSNLVFRGLATLRVTNRASESS